MAQPKRATLHSIGQSIMRRIHGLPQVKMPDPIEPNQWWKERFAKSEEDKRFILQEGTKTAKYTRDIQLACDKHEMNCEAELERHTDDVRIALSSIKKQQRSKAVVNDLEAFEAAVVDLCDRVLDPKMRENGIKMLAEVFGVDDEEDEETDTQCGAGAN